MGGQERRSVGRVERRPGGIAHPCLQAGIPHMGNSVDKYDLHVHHIRPRRPGDEKAARLLEKMVRIVVGQVGFRVEAGCPRPCDGMSVHNRPRGIRRAVAPVGPRREERRSPQRPLFRGQRRGRAPCCDLRAHAPLPSPSSPPRRSGRGASLSLTGRPDVLWPPLPHVQATGPPPSPLRGPPQRGASPRSRAPAPSASLPRWRPYCSRRSYSSPSGTGGCLLSVFQGRVRGRLRQGDGKDCGGPSHRAGIFQSRAARRHRWCCRERSVPRR